MKEGLAVAWTSKQPGVLEFIGCGGNLGYRRGQFNVGYFLRSSFQPRVGQPQGNCVGLSVTISEDVGPEVLDRVCQRICSLVGRSIAFYEHGFVLQVLLHLVHHVDKNSKVEQA